MTDLSRDELRQWLDMLRDDMQSGFSGVNARLDKMNDKVSVHAVKIGVLEDRSNVTSDPAARWGAVGTMLAAASYAIWHAVSGGAK